MSGKVTQRGGNAQMKFVFLVIRLKLQTSRMPILLVKTIDPAGKLCVWHATEDAQTLISQLELGEEDMRIFESLRNRNRKLQWLGCRMALSHLLQTPAIEIRYDEYGKPSLASGTHTISFSHTGLYAAAMCSTAGIAGIDIELIRDKISRVADRFLALRELQMVSGSDRLETLTLFWAAKEVLYKINGKPDLDMQHDICIESFDYLCSANGELKARLNLQGKATEISVYYQTFDTFILAWATEKETK